MFLIPSFGETPEHVLTQTSLPQDAADAGILVIIPTFKTGISSMGFDTATQASFLEILDHAISRHKLKNLKFYVGGFSIGGTCAVKYAELANKHNYIVKPAGVFAIDPPLDFERFYYSAARNTRLPKTGEPNEESVYMVNRISEEMGGSPENARNAFYTRSPYAAGDSTKQAIKNLQSTPVMLFCEPDTTWWMTNRGMDFRSMNIVDCSRFVEDLKSMGNQNALLVTTKNKGFRQPDRQRHPHSWSIAEPKVVVDWMLEL